MNRFVKAVALTAVAGATTMGTASGALAHDHGGASASAVAKGSPGFLSGNVIQVPISIPINVCGNSVNGLALLNPTVGNFCMNK